MMERRRKFRCSKCGSEFYMHAKIEQFNVIPKPVRCIEGNGQCNSTSFSAVPSDAAESLVNCVDYQELKVAWTPMDGEPGAVGRMTLQYDLVDVAKSGDEVTIVGRLIRRWRALQINERPDITLALHANYVQVHNSQTSQQSSTNNMEERFNRFWNEHSAMPITGRCVHGGFT
ncbi:DNA helicase mcm9, partial [Spiromyces aspiralis]